MHGKARKMLGSADAPGVVALMRQMETQSRETLARWSAGYARESLLPICLAAHPQDTLPAQLLALAMDWAEGRCDGKTVRPLLAALRMPPGRRQPRRCRRLCGPSVRRRP